MMPILLSLFVAIFFASSVDMHASEREKSRRAESARDYTAQSIFAGFCRAAFIGVAGVLVYKYYYDSTKTEKKLRSCETKIKRLWEEQERQSCRTSRIEHGVRTLDRKTDGLHGKVDKLDAKVDRRAGELRGELVRLGTRTDDLHAKADAQARQLDGMSAQVTGVDSKIDGVRGDVARLSASTASLHGKTDELGRNVRRGYVYQKFTVGVLGAVHRSAARTHAGVIAQSAQLGRLHTTLEEVQATGNVTQQELRDVAATGRSTAQNVKDLREQDIPALTAGAMDMKSDLTALRGDTERMGKVQTRMAGKLDEVHGHTSELKRDMKELVSRPQHVCPSPAHKPPSPPLSLSSPLRRAVTGAAVTA